ncbi:MAG: AmmeMemoRadiSam system protein B [Candidatus Glassbacteria bacterium]
MEKGLAVRKPAVAGTFYPADTEELKVDIKSYLAQVMVDRSDKDIVALVAPHAGYMYSGPVAAHAYRQVQGKAYESVVVISPSHRESFDFSSIFNGNAYETPLGSVPVDHSLVEELIGAGEKSVKASGEGHLHSEEHALEVHIPFLQTVLGEFKLVPIVMGSQSRSSCRELGRALARVLAGRNALVVASTDLSHFHDQNFAGSLDKIVIGHIGAFDPDGLLDDIEAHKCEACGAGPVAAAMYAAREMGATRAENLYYATSGDISGNYTRVVGYTAGIIYR